MRGPKSCTTLSLNDKQREDDTAQDLHLHTVNANHYDIRTCTDVVHFMPPTAVSIVSDIDDTVKVTNVGNKTEFAKKKCLQTFRPVPE